MFDRKQSDAEIEALLIPMLLFYYSILNNEYHDY